MSDAKRKVRAASGSFVSFTRSGMVVDLERYLRTERGREFLEQFDVQSVDQEKECESNSNDAIEKNQA